MHSRSIVSKLSKDKYLCMISKSKSPSAQTFAGPTWNMLCPMTSDGVYELRPVKETDSFTVEPFCNQQDNIM